MDFFLWAELLRRMVLQRPPKKETVEEYETRLRRAAMGIPKAVVQKAVLDIHVRARAVVIAKGGDVPGRLSPRGQQAGRDVVSELSALVWQGKGLAARLCLDEVLFGSAERPGGEGGGAVDFARS